MRTAIYRRPPVQDIYDYFSKLFYGPAVAEAMLAAGYMDADELALEGVEPKTLTALMDFGVLIVELEIGWSPIEFVRCGGHTGCDRCANGDRRKGAACLKIKNDQTGEIVFCEGWRYALSPQQPDGWLGEDDVDSASPASETAIDRNPEPQLTATGALRGSAKALFELAAEGKATAQMSDKEITDLIEGRTSHRYSDRMIQYAKKAVWPKLR